MKYSMHQLKEGFEEVVQIVGGFYLLGEAGELIAKTLGFGKGPKKNAPQMANATERFSAVMKTANLTEGGASNGNAKRLDRYFDEVFGLTRTDVGVLVKAQNEKRFEDFQQRIVIYEDSPDGVSGEEILRHIGKELRRIEKEPQTKEEVYQNLKQYFATRKLPYPPETGIGDTIARVVAFGDAHRANRNRLVKLLGK